MSGIRSSDASKAAIDVWQQRGATAARARRVARPPALPGAAAAYMDGFRRADRKR